MVERAGAGGAQIGVGARGQATWAVSTACTRMWVSDGCGEDGADKGPRRSGRERARGRTVHGADEAALQRREKERAGRTREGSRRRQVGLTGQRERGSEGVLSLKVGPTCQRGAGARRRPG
jgi:hypothetical protein